VSRRREAFRSFDTTSLIQQPRRRKEGMARRKATFHAILTCNYGTNREKICQPEGFQQPASTADGGSRFDPGRVRHSSVPAIYLSS
jgi:hypothetical protein